MNSLSWLIYLAGVTGSLGNFLVFITVVLGMLTAISTIVWLWSMDETDSRHYRLPDDVITSKREIRKSSWRRAWGFGMLMVMLGSVAALMPSRQTVLLIAASQMGEQVLNHPRINQVVDPGIELLTTWMQKETAELRNNMQPNNNNRR